MRGYKKHHRIFPFSWVFVFLRDTKMGYTSMILSISWTHCRAIASRDIRTIRRTSTTIVFQNLFRNKNVWGYLLNVDKRIADDPWSPPCQYRCRSRHVFGGVKDFCPNFRKLAWKIFSSLIARIFCREERLWDDLQKSGSSCDFECHFYKNQSTFDAIFACIFRDFAQIFRDFVKVSKVFTDFAQTSADFAWIYIK